MKKQICNGVESVFVIHFSNFFRGSGIEVVLLVRAADEGDALTKFATSYLGWEQGTFELIDAKARQKFFYEGEVQIEIWQLTTILKKLEKQEFEILFEIRVPDEV